MSKEIMQKELLSRRNVEHYREFNKQQRLLFSSCVIINEVIYSVTSLGKNLIKFDLRTGKLMYIEDLKKVEFLYTEDILNDGSDLYMLEQDGYRMMRFQVENNQYQYYDIDCHKKAWGNYAAYVKYKNSMYIFPRYGNNIVIINLETGAVVKTGDLYSYMIDSEKVIRNLEEDILYFWNGVVSASTVWLFPRKGKWVIAYDLETGHWKNYELPCEIECCNHIVRRENRFYILDADGKVYIWDKDNDSMKFLGDCSELTSDGTFSRIAITEKRIFLMPSLSGNICWIDLECGEKGIYDDYPEGFYYCAPEAWSKYLGYCEDDKNYYFAMRSSLFILCIDKQKSEIKWIRAIVPSDKEYCRMSYKDSKEKIFSEREWSIIEVVDYLEQEGACKECEVIGKHIWDRMKDC